MQVSGRSCIKYLETRLEIQTMVYVSRWFNGQFDELLDVRIGCHLVN